MSRRLCAQAGQTAAEYMGALLLVSVIVAALAAVGGAVGAWQARRAPLLTAVLGPLLGALLILAIDPDASLWTIVGLVAIAARPPAAARST